MRNGNWKVYKHNCGRVIVENIKTGFCDWPIKYDNGKIAYDHPYQIPTYVKKLVVKYHNQ